MNSQLLTFIASAYLGTNSPGGARPSRVALEPVQPNVQVGTFAGTPRRSHELQIFNHLSAGLPPILVGNER